MNKNYLILCNLLLAVFLAFRLYVLYEKVTPAAVKKLVSLDYPLLAVTRPAVEVAGHYRNIFGVISPETPVGRGRRPGGKAVGQTELVTEDEIIRVRGIFLTGGRGYAVITITGRRQKSREEVIKVSPGDTFRGFTVNSISPRAVTLTAGSSGSVLHLKIFKPALSG